MPKLDLLSANEFWKNYDDPMVYRVIAFMESVENFTLDGNLELEKAVDKIGESLDALTTFEVGKEDDCIALFTHLKSSRILRFLQTVDTLEPGSASKILMYAEENNFAGNPMVELFLRRNVVFERLRLLARVFSSERIEMVTNLLEGGN